MLQCSQPASNVIGRCGFGNARFRVIIYPMTHPPLHKRYIAHVDMDAFFASVEQRDDPALRGRPVIVGADPKGGKGRGVVAACSYEARKFGIHSAMPISIAYNKCPQAAFLSGNMSKYADVSREIMVILETFTPDIEPVSIDEAFMDITGSFHHFGTPLATCRKIKAVILEKTGLIASIGLAPNMMTAKIASDIGKPDGLVEIKQRDLLSFLHPLPIRKLWGIGEKTALSLKNIGIETIGDIAKRGMPEIEHAFGKNGLHIWQLANGVDPRRVEPTDTVKSISNEYTFDRDTRETHALLDALMRLSEKVSHRLRADGFKGKTITLKIRFSDFRTYTRSITLKTPTNFTDVIYTNVALKAGDFDTEKRAVRLVGVRVSGLALDSLRDDLFDEIPNGETEKRERIHLAFDRIRDKFGEQALSRRTCRQTRIRPTRQKASRD